MFTDRTAASVDLIDLRFHPMLVVPPGTALIDKASGAVALVLDSDGMRPDGGPVLGPQWTAEDHLRMNTGGLIAVSVAGQRAGVPRSRFMAPQAVLSAAPSAPAPSAVSQAQPSRLPIAAPAAPQLPVPAAVTAGASARPAPAPVPHVYGALGTNAKGKDKDKHEVKQPLPRPLPRGDGGDGGNGTTYQANRQKHDAARTELVSKAQVLAQQMVEERRKSIAALGRDLSPGEALLRAQRSLNAA